MFCPSCGKQIKEDDNFCRYCGKNLKEEIVLSDNDEKISEENFSYDGEELVLYEVEKHWMSLVLPVFLTPLFLIYFWTIFLNTHSIFSWVIMFTMLFLIIYPIAIYKEDKIIITTKCAHIKSGILNPVELEIPLSKFDIFNITQSSIGRILDYGTITFCVNSEKFEHRYIKSPENFEYIVENPERFLKESLENA